MILLVTKTDIGEYRQLATNVPDKVINPFITDAQFSDVQKLLGSDFYNDLIRNYTDLKYVELLEGGSYEHKGTTYTNVGLKVVISHYAYARYVLLGSNIDTPFGFVTKDSDSSTQSDLATKKTVYKENVNLAFNYWENVLDFLARKSSEYPLFKQNCFTKGSKFRISKIG